MEQRLDTGLIKGHAYGITAVEKVRNALVFLYRLNVWELLLERFPWPRFGPHSQTKSTTHNSGKIYEMYTY